MHLTNNVILKFNEMTILQNLCKDKDYFFNYKKIGINVGTKMSIYSLKKII